MTKTMDGAIERALECVMQNVQPDVVYEPRDIITWAVGAAMRYLRDEPEPTGTKQELLPPQRSGMTRSVLPEQQRKAALATGFTGDPCDTCGNFTLKRTGTCVTCQTCGNNTGCS